MYDTVEQWCVVSVRCALPLHVPKHVFKTTVFSVAGEVVGCIICLVCLVVSLGWMPHVSLQPGTFEPVTTRDEHH